MKNRFKIRSATRLALSLVAITAMLVWSAQSLKVIPSQQELRLQHRLKTCESLALQTTSSIKSNRTAELARIATAITQRDSDINSIALKRRNGNLAFATEGHDKYWTHEDKNTQDQIAVDLDINGKTWGTLQLAFVPRGTESFYGMLRMILFLSAGAGVLSWIVLSRSLTYLNPTKVVPQRVRSAFETLAEGLMLLDKDGVIVHANQKLSQMVHLPFEDLIGRKVSDILWKTESQSGEFSWETSLRTREQICGELMTMKHNGVTYMYTANAAPILEANGKCRGVMVSFDDVTALENKKADLARMVTVLRNSRDQVAKQNEELQFLASRDPLTKCYNRRSFWEVFDRAWTDTPSDKLSMIMIDIDFFKKINDTHGHSIGDQVLRELGGLLLDLFEKNSMVCRFGGEEFAVLLTDADIEQATALVARLQSELHRRQIGGLRVTASIGLTNRVFGAMDPQHLLDQADQSLYVAKRAGRDRFVRFDRIDSTEVDQVADSNETEAEPTRPIQYSVVTGLLGALAIRSQPAAEHSVRVADLSVALGKKFLQSSQLYELEIGALLHDIGKIGLPDSNTKSPPGHRAGPDSVQQHADSIGAEIVKLSFGSSQVTEIIRCQGFWYGAYNPEVEQDSIKHHIPVGARVVSLCNAFDNLIHLDGLDHASALQNLAGRTTEFDPELLQLLAQVLVEQPEIFLAQPRQKTTAQSALAIGSYIESLYAAMESQDVSTMKDCVRAIQKDSSVGLDEPTASAANELEMILESETGEMDEILQVAQTVIDLCRSARNSFIVSDEIQSFVDQRR